MVSIQNIIDNKKLAVTTLRKIKWQIYLFIFWVVVSFLLFCLLIAAYSYYSFTNDWYSYSIFFYFIYPFFCVFYITIAYFLLFLLHTSVTEKIQYEEISTLIFRNNNVTKIKNIFWCLYKIHQINRIIKALQKERPNAFTIQSFIK